MPTNNKNNRTAAIYDPSGNLRIRKPHPHDVLSGRGGGINSHSGNRVFRGWVHVRKQAYNLAVAKVEKAEVAHQVMKLVQHQTPPGRFLQRDPTNGTSSGQTSWWVELDASRALTKTSQALREGAPQIRASHKEGRGSCKNKKMERARKAKRKSRATSAPNRRRAAPKAAKKSTATTEMNVQPTTAPLNKKAIRDLLQDNMNAPDQAKKRFAASGGVGNSSVPPPLLSDQDFEAKLTRLPKRGKYLHPPPLPEDYATSTTTTTTTAASASDAATTPTLTSIPASLTSIPIMTAAEAPVGGLPCGTNKLLLRTHSSAWSDFSNIDADRAEDLNQDFVNPFDDESDIYSIHNVPRSGEAKSFNNNNNGRNNGSNFNSRIDSGDDESAFLLDLDFAGKKSVCDVVYPNLGEEPTLLLPRNNSCEALKKLLRSSPLGTPRSSTKQRGSGRE